MENDLWSEKQLSRQNYLTDRPETWHKYSQLPARPSVKILTTTIMAVQKLITLNSDGITEKLGGYLGIPSHYPLLFKPFPP